MTKSVLNITETSANKSLTSNVNDKKIIILFVISFLQLFMCKTLVKRVISLIFIAAGLPNSVITELTGYCDRSVRQLKKNVASGQTKDIFIIKKSNKSKFNGIEDAIKNDIDTNKYSSMRQIADMIKNKFGIKSSLYAIRKLLKTIGVKLLKSGSLPAKADIKAQRTFYEAILRPLMDKAKSGSIALLFFDASHFVMGDNFLGRFYGSVRRFIKTFSGRMRYNVLGALNFVTKNVTTVTNNTYITATEVCILLKKLSEEYTGIPLYVILDNARYQKCKIVQTLAKDLGINLIYIPPYSPNLNLIERFWKYVKSNLRTTYYNNFPDFCNAIDSLCSNNKDKKTLDSLISDKVSVV